MKYGYRSYLAQSSYVAIVIWYLQ